MAPVLPEHPNANKGVVVELRNTTPPADLDELDGEPKIRARVEIWPHQEDLSTLTAADLHAIGMVVTGLPVVNAIPSVCGGGTGSPQPDAVSSLAE